MLQLNAERLEEITQAAFNATTGRRDERRWQQAIVRCVPTLPLNHDLDHDGAISQRERAFGDYTNGREAWQLADARAIDPIPCRGALSLWTVPAEIEAQIKGVLL